MTKAGKRGAMFSGTCDRCICHSERLITVLLFVQRWGETTRELKNFCPGCRHATKYRWRWPEPMSNDAEVENAIRAQEAVSR